MSTLIYSSKEENLVNETHTSTVVQNSNNYSLIQSGSVQGIQGPPGTNGIDGATASLVVSCLASEAIGGGRVVRIIWDRYVGYVSSDNTALATTVLGITTGAAVYDDPIGVQYTGELQDSGWSWVPGPIYCGINGVITQTPPTSGFILAIGTAINATTIVINIKQPLILS
jgi:hypothetical protein